MRMCVGVNGGPLIHHFIIGFFIVTIECTKIQDYAEAGHHYVICERRP